MDKEEFKNATSPYYTPFRHLWSCILMPGPKWAIFWMDFSSTSVKLATEILMEETKFVVTEKKNLIFEKNPF